MKKIKEVFKIFLVLILLTSCRTLINKDEAEFNSEGDINELTNLEKKRIEIRFSCEDDGIKEYLDDGWIILKEESQEKVCAWKSFPATKGCDMEKEKGCKIIKPDKIGEEKMYLLEK